MSPRAPKKRPDEAVRGWLIGGVGVVLCGTLLSLTMLIHQQQDDEASTKVTSRDDKTPAEVTADPHHATSQRRATHTTQAAPSTQEPTPHEGVKAPAAQAALMPSPGERDERSAQEDAPELAQLAPPAQEDERLAQEDAPDETLTYTDPINAQVLGPGQWMARLEPPAQAHLDELIDSSPVPELLAQQQRQTQAVVAARALATDAAQTCLMQWRHIMPKTSGQVMIAAWLVHERPGVTRLIRPSIQAVVRLSQPEFLDCLLAQVRDARLPVDGPDELRVELPLFLD